MRANCDMYTRVVKRAGCNVRGAADMRWEGATTPSIIEAHAELMLASCEGTLPCRLQSALTPPHMQQPNCACRQLRV